MAITVGTINTDTVHTGTRLINSQAVNLVGEAQLHILDCSAIADGDTITVPGAVACASKNSTGDLAAVLSNQGDSNATVTWAAVSGAANVAELFYWTINEQNTAPSSSNVTIAVTDPDEKYGQNLQGCQMLFIPVSDVGTLSSTTYDPGVANIVEVAWEPTNSTDEVTVSVSDGDTVSFDDGGTNNAAGTLWLWHGSAPNNL